MDAQVLPKQPGDPRRLGPYELIGRLGEGGMGVVFLGRQRRGGRLAAVKALRPELAGDPTFAGRFRREVDAARRVDSRHVARVLDADPAADRPWLATEYVDGATLASAVASSGPLAGERLVSFATGVAEALAAIHAAEVVHRDLKPSNVLLQRDPAAAPAATAPLALGTPSPARPTRPLPGLAGVKVIDFGIAWAADATRTRSGLRLGTPAWMAPEQLRGQVAGPPADVFAWGALVAFAATGRHPFGGGPAEAVAYRVLHDPPDLRGVPRPMRDLVERALSREPSARPTAPRLVSTLPLPATPTLPLPATGPTLVLPVAAAASAEVAGPTRRRRRRRVGRLLVAAALLAGLAATPQVVLAAVAGPDDGSGRHTAKHCPGDHDDRGDAEGAHDHEPEDEEGDEGKHEGKDEGESEDEEADAGATRDGYDPTPSPPAPPAPAPGAPHPHAPDGGAPVREGSPKPEAVPGAVHSPPASTPPSIPDPGDEVLGS